MPRKRKEIETEVNPPEPKAKRTRQPKSAEAKAIERIQSSEEVEWETTFEIGDSIDLEAVSQRLEESGYAKRRTKVAAASALNELAQLETKDSTLSSNLGIVEVLPAEELPVEFELPQVSVSPVPLIGMEPEAGILVEIDRHTLGMQLETGEVATLHSYDVERLKIKEIGVKATGAIFRYAVPGHLPMVHVGTLKLKK